MLVHKRLQNALIVNRVSTARVKENKNHVLLATGAIQEQGHLVMMTRLLVALQMFHNHATESLPLDNTLLREAVVRLTVLQAHTPLLKVNQNVHLVKLDISVIMSVVLELKKIVNGSAQRATIVHHSRPT